MTRPGGGDRGVHLDLHAMSDMRRRSRLLWSPTPPLHTATRSRSRTRAGTRGRAQRTRVQRGLPRLVHRPPSHQHTSTTPPPLRLGGRTERERAVDATREYTASHSSRRVDTTVQISSKPRCTTTSRESGTQTVKKQHFFWRSNPHGTRDY